MLDAFMRNLKEEIYAQSPFFTCIQSKIHSCSLYLLHIRVRSRITNDAIALRAPSRRTRAVEALKITKSSESSPRRSLPVVSRSHLCARYGFPRCSRLQIRSSLIRVAGAFARPSFNESEIMPGVPRRRDINHARARYVREHNVQI